MIDVPDWRRPLTPYEWRHPRPLVGRVEELAIMERAWLEVRQGTRRVVMVGGESGAGKSRLVAQAAVAAHEREAAVLVGACVADLGLPYQPFVRPIEAVSSAFEGSLADRLAVLAGRGSVLPHPEHRRELYDAAVNAFAAIAERQPLVLVLEDLHWANQASNQLLTYLVEHTTDVSLLVLATHRTTAADRQDYFVRTLAHLDRLDGVHRVELGGLDTDAVAEYLRADGVPAEQAAPAATLLRDQTGGNPFFLRELWRDLATRGGVLAVRSGEVMAPQSVRDALEARLETFSSDQRQVLEQAAVLGQDFDLGLLLPAAQCPDEVALSAVDTAVRVRLIEPDPAIGGAFRFVHALARQAVLDLTPPSRRLRAHARIADVIEARKPVSDDQIRQLAHHFTEASVLGYTPKAIEYLRLAANIAGRDLAHLDAANLLEQAARLSADPAQQFDLLLEAAGRHLLGSNFNRTHELSVRVAAESDGTLQLRAAILFEEACWWTGREDARTAELLTQALPAAPSGDLHIRALTSLGRALAFNGRMEEAEAVSSRAIALARTAADDDLLAGALLGTQRVILPNLVDPSRSATDDLRRARDLWALAARTGNAAHLAPAAYHRAIMAYTYGAPDDLAAAHHDLNRSAHTTGQSILEYQAACVRYAQQFVTGQFQAAEQTCTRARDFARAHGALNVEGPYGLHIFMIRRETGGLERIRPLITGRERPEGTWTPGLLALYTGLGLVEPASNLLRWILDEDLDHHRTSGTWPGVLAFLVEAAQLAGERAAARRLRPLLADYAGCNLICGGFDAVFGSADRYLGIIDSLVGTGDPRAQFAAAMKMDGHMEAPLHRLHTLLARWQHERRAGSGSAVDRLADDIRRQARALGSQRVLRALPPARHRRPASPDGLTPRELEVLILLGRGLTNRQIAHELSISENTAANHVRSILMKTGSENRTQAAIYVAEHGLS